MPESKCTRTNRTYSLWLSMRQRCRESKYYINISVCKRWEKYENFLEDMGKAPDKLTLDRINPKLGYSKENCRWATRSQQQRNIQKQSHKEFKGTVYKGGKEKRKKRWYAQIKVDGKKVSTPHFLTEAEAARAYDVLAKKHFGEYACLNF